jgi:hypothetical protein
MYRLGLLEVSACAWISAAGNDDVDNVCVRARVSTLEIGKREKETMIDKVYYRISHVSFL